MSSDALIAWGIDFGDRRNTEEGFDFAGRGLDTDEMELQFPALFGFTEARPRPPQGLGHDEHPGWHCDVRVPYDQRLDAAVPVRFQAYGYELGGEALVLKRSLTTVEWACRTVDPGTLAVPTDAEVAAVGAVFARWDIAWPQNVKLLLMAHSEKHDPRDVQGPQAQGREEQGDRRASRLDQRAADAVPVRRPRAGGHRAVPPRHRPGRQGPVVDGRWGAYMYAPGTHELCEQGHAKAVGGPCRHNYCLGAW